MDDDLTLFIDWLEPDGWGYVVVWLTLDRDMAAHPIDDQYVIDLELVCPLVEIAIRMFAPCRIMPVCCPS